MPAACALQAVTHGFADGHDVRDDFVALEAPPLLTGTAEARLDFIRDVQAAGGTYLFDDGAEEAGRASENTIGGEDAVGDEGRQSYTVSVKISDGCTYLVPQVILQRTLLRGVSQGVRGIDDPRSRPGARRRPGTGRRAEDDRF